MTKGPHYQVLFQGDPSPSAAGRIVIRDSNLGGLSVTNGAEQVVEELIQAYGSGCRIFYYDSEGDYAEPCHNGVRFTNFAAAKEN